MTTNRTVRRTLGGLSAVAVVAGAALVVLSPPAGAALSDPGVYGLVLLGAAAGLLVALAALAAADPDSADTGATPPPAGTESRDAGTGGVRADPGPASGSHAADGAGNDTAGEPVPGPTAGPAAEPDTGSGADTAGEGATAETDSIDSVQELFEQVADEEPGSLVDEDAAEGEFLFGGDRDRE